MPSQLKNRITEDMKAAMKAQAKERLGIIRLILAAIKQREVDERIELDDAQIITVLEKMLKQRQESIAQYQTAKRDDLVKQETFEVGVIKEYMPAALSEAEVKALIEAAFNETQAKAMADMGKVMAYLKPRIQGRADMSAISQAIKNRLTST